MYLGVHEYDIMELIPSSEGNNYRVQVQIQVQVQVRFKCKSRVDINLVYECAVDELIFQISIFSPSSRSGHVLPALLGTYVASYLHGFCCLSLK